MKIVVLGDPDDVRGFALAGAYGRACGDPGELETALAEAVGPEAAVGIVVLSASVAALAPAAVAAARGRADGPIILVLPDRRIAEGAA